MSGGADVVLTRRVKISLGLLNAFARNPIVYRLSAVAQHVQEEAVQDECAYRDPSQ